MLPLREENLKFDPIFKSQHSVMAPASSANKVERGSTTVHLPLRNGVKTVSKYKQLDGDIFSTNSTPQKRDGQKHRTLSPLSRRRAKPDQIKNINRP